MQTKSTFTDAGWDFKGESANGTEDIWTICQGQTYPRLVRKRMTGDFGGRDGVDMVDFAFFAACWRQDNCGQCEPADLTENGDIDADDLKELTQNWLPGL
jgi:hypothetical protein